MSKGLYTQNAMANLFGKDRATIKRAVAGMEPEGRIGGYDAFYLPKVAAALGVDGGDMLAASLLDRVYALSNHSISDAQLMSIESFAAANDVPVATVLRWMKAGMPFWREGDWQTGDGFVLRAAWAIDWLALVGGRLRQHAPDTARLLGV